MKLSECGINDVFLNIGLEIESLNNENTRLRRIISEQI